MNEIKVGETYLLVNNNGKHGYMLSKGIYYTLLRYDKTDACPFKFTSDWGDRNPYMVTEETFHKDFRQGNFGDFSIKLRF